MEQSVELGGQGAEGQQEQSTAREIIRQDPNLLLSLLRAHQSMPCKNLARMFWI